MPIDAIGTIQALSGAGAVAPSTETPASGGSGFATALTGAVDKLQSLQSNSDALAITAATGGLDDIHSATIAATRAQVTIELASAMRNKAVDAFNEIMRMQA